MSAAKRTVFTGGSVFDGVSDSLSTADVVIADGRIVDVGVGCDADEAVDVTGRSVLPGLFDCHVHVMVEHIDLLRLMQQPLSYGFYVAEKNLRRMLDVGITNARDACGADLGIKQALADGLIAGPRLQISLAMISQTGGHADGWLPSGACLHELPSHPGIPQSIVDGPEEVRRVVRELVRAGADVIKIASSGGVMSPRDNPRRPHFAPDELKMAVQEATAAGLPVMAHAQSTQGIKNAVRAGVRSIEHGIFLDDEAVELMRDRGTFLVPTLLAPLSVMEAIEAGAGLTDAMKAKVLDVAAAHGQSFALAVQAGVRIAMGTDAVGFPHGRNLEELELMVSHGMAPLAALRAATSEAADLMGCAEFGRIARGFRADLVVVDGDVTDVGNLGSRIRAVYQDGRLVSRDTQRLEPTGGADAYPVPDQPTEAVRT